jgi:predicted ribosome quality control (RQC) complex YloA/Tae2 family protein
VAFTADELRAVLDELRPRLVGARVRRVHQPRSHEIVLTLRSREEATRLLVSVHPRRGRVHLLERPRVNPPEPPPFGYLLRRHLEGGRIESLHATPGDRVARIEIHRGGKRLDLVVELFGGRAAVLLLDGEGRILASNRGDLSEGRSGRPGDVYAPPTARPASDGPPPQPGTHDRIARREEEAEAEEGLEDRRRRRVRDLDREIKRLTRLRDKLEADRAGLHDPETCRQRGEALKAALHEVPRGADEVTLTTWTEEGETRIRVPLDPRRDSKTNMERWFRRARRSERARILIGERLEEIREKLADVAADRERALVGDPPEESAREAPRPGKAKTPGPKGPPRFVSRDGYVIFVGRSAEENDEVTFRIGKGNDTWLHVRDRPGAHVVIRTPPGRPPPLETLLDAAVLAVHHSPARGSSGVEVAYTLRKHVRKPRGAPRGLVSVAGERSLRVDPDEERLARLYGTRDGNEASE